MKKIYLLVLILLFPLFTAEAGIASLLGKTLKNAGDSVPTKTDNFIPQSISDIDRPASQVLSETAPASQILSTSPQKIMPESMGAAEDMVKRGQGEIIEKSTGEFYFIPNPLPLVSDGYQYSKTEENESTWVSYLLSLGVFVLVAWFVYSWVAVIFRLFRGIFSWFKG